MLQDEVFDILVMGYNVFLTGPAGSGKTYLVNRFIRHCHMHGISVAVTASTGIAATHIGGMTIHSWSGMGIRDTLTQEDLEQIVSREYLMKRFTKTSVLIIDEISMLSGKFLESLDILLQRARVSPEPFGGMQIVFVGDFFQLPPVSRDMSPVEYAFEHSSWRTFRLAICALSTQFRQDSKEDPLLCVLNEIRSGEVSPSSRRLLQSRNVRIETDDHTELFTKNISVDTYNTEKLNSIAGDIFIFTMESQGAEKLVESLKKGCLAPESLVLKVGARVMFVKNNFEKGYVNGSLGHIIGRDEGYPIVELLDGTVVTAEPASWTIEENGRVKAEIMQVPLRLAWAITVHKSQGMTLDSAVMDLSDAFVAGQGYVALSRVRSLEGLVLRGYNEMTLQIDPRVIEYDRILRATSEKVSEKIQTFSEREKIQRQNDAIVRLGGEINPKGRDIPFAGGSMSSYKKGSSKKVSTQEETLHYITMGLSIEEIAYERKLKNSTIVSHIEMLQESGMSFDIERFRPKDEERVRAIHDAFRALSTLQLSPVREYLLDVTDDEYDYDEIRLARIFLSPADRAKIEADILYASEGIG